MKSICWTAMIETFYNIRDNLAQLIGNGQRLDMTGGDQKAHRLSQDLTNHLHTRDILFLSNVYDREYRRL